MVPSCGSRKGDEIKLTTTLTLYGTLLSSGYSLKMVNFLMPVSVESKQEPKQIIKLTVVFIRIVHTGEDLL